MELNRRRFLQAGGTAALMGTAGCDAPHKALWPYTGLPDEAKPPFATPSGESIEPHHPRAQSPHVRREAGAARAHSPLGQARGGCRGQVHRRTACAGKNQRRSRRVSRAEIRDTRPCPDRRVLRVPAPPPPRRTHPRHADPRRLLGASAVRGDGSVLERPLQHRHLQGRMQMAQAGRRPERHSATRAWKVPRTPRRLGQEPGDAHLP